MRQNEEELLAVHDAAGEIEETKQETEPVKDDEQFIQDLKHLIESQTKKKKKADAVQKGKTKGIFEIQHDINLEKALFPQAVKDKIQKQPIDQDANKSSSDSECVKNELDLEPKKLSLDEANQEIKDRLVIVVNSDSEEVQSSLEKIKSSESQLE